MADDDTGGVAFVLKRMTLKPGVDHDAFEAFMLNELFPSLAASDTDEDPDQHFLLQEEESPPVYVWMARLHYGIHQTPMPVWLIDRVKELDKRVQESVAPYGEGMPSQVQYDVARWRRILGK